MARKVSTHVTVPIVLSMAGFFQTALIYSALPDRKTMLQVMLCQFLVFNIHISSVQQSHVANWLTHWTGQIKNSPITPEVLLAPLQTMRNH